jgi:hypothetical protein
MRVVYLKDHGSKSKDDVINVNPYYLTDLLKQKIVAPVDDNETNDEKPKKEPIKTTTKKTK